MYERYSASCALWADLLSIQSAQRGNLWRVANKHTKVDYSACVCVDFLYKPFENTLFGRVSVQLFVLHTRVNRFHIHGANHNY